MTFSLAPWRSPLARALHGNRSLVYARYVQLATVRPNGRPANRTVVFRGFLAETNQLQFVVDRRSAKIEQIELQPGAEACWYFPKTREQFRLSGSLCLVTADCSNTALLQARQTLWQSLSDAARSQFTWAHPGQPLPAQSPADLPNPDPPYPLHPLANFCLLLLEPEQVDHLELRGEPQNRSIYLKENAQWQMTKINP